MKKDILVNPSDFDRGPSENFLVFFDLQRRRGVISSFRILDKALHVTQTFVNGCTHERNEDQVQKAQSCVASKLLVIDKSD